MVGFVFVLRETLDKPEVRRGGEEREKNKTRFFLRKRSGLRRETEDLIPCVNNPYHNFRAVTLPDFVQFS